jgi:ribosomal protein S18 acetylase RimI-like enzyme
MTCEQMRELAPELALDIADGEQRAETLRHLGDCADCRRLVEQLSEVADELLTLAPTQEPPVGFESRVLERLDLPARPRRARWRGLALRVAAPLAAAAATAAVLVAVYHDDHVTASRYLATLHEANGKYFDARSLRDPAGVRAGIAFTYEGRPSWLLVTVDRSHRGAVASGEVITRGGRAIRLGGFRLRPDGTWGGGIPVSPHDVASIRLLGRRPGEVLQAAKRRD